MWEDEEGGEKGEEEVIRIERGIGLRGLEWGGGG